MLLHSGGHVQPSCYYPDPSYLPQHATPPPPHFDIDAFLSHPSAYQGHTPTPTTPITPCPTPRQQTYYHHHQHHQHHTHHHHHHQQDASGGSLHQFPNPSPYFSCSCGCPWKPVQETFLHKILTGKGYKNDAMCVGHHGPFFPRTTDSGHFNVGPGSAAGAGEFAAMATSCCYSRMSGMAMPAAGFPPSIPGL